MKHLSKPRTFRYGSLSLRILPGVFHPGLFISTIALLQFVRQNISLNKIRVLELGAGSGLISLFCRQMGASVTASDISDIALKNIELNALKNNLSFDFVKSDLFERVHPEAFDLILINPPYYPKNAASESELAWFCGSNFEYFHKLFFELQQKRQTKNKILMILSDDCQINRIQEIARGYSHDLSLQKIVKTWLEFNFVFSIERI